MLKIKKITSRNFRRYGWVIEYPGKNLCGRRNNLFRIVLREAAKTGWRIAYLVVRDRSISRLEQHPDSFESFEPVAGKSILFVCAGKNNDKTECFRLERPVVLKKGIWHGIISVGRESEIKITENSRVKCAYRSTGGDQYGRKKDIVGRR